jgi:hypothetical protein
MKKNIVLILVLGGSCVIATLSLLLRQKSKNIIQVFYNANIKKMPIGTLKNLRSKSEQEKKKLFESFTSVSSFKIQNICKRIRSIQNPHIIVWFTDHFGQVPAKGLEWYKQNIFSQCASQSATFWLIDLAAWRYLSIKETQLRKSSDFVLFERKKSEGQSLPIQECPLLSDQSDLFPQVLNTRSQMRFLRASDFFAWLSQTDLQFSTINLNTLVRDDLRSGAARFSLRQLGFRSSFLTDNKKNETSFIDLDNSQIFPLLQYLEALYYVLRIVESDQVSGAESCNIVFLLPNKEFTYYLVQGESRPFETFKKNLDELLQKNNRLKLKVSVYFYPFAYGNGFYDQPFEEEGDLASLEEISRKLTNNKN